MQLPEFEASLTNSEPPALPEPLQALWHEANDNWDLAHRIVQSIESRDAYWVHAYLHRVEGDLGNAGYWYRRANKMESRIPLKEEWSAIATELLNGAA